MQSSHESEEPGEAPETQEAEQPGAETADAPPDLAAQLAAIEDRYKRALADLDNYRKRAGREIESRVQQATDASLRDWLQAVDSVERAMQMDPDGPCAVGLRAIFEQMETVLARQGMVRLGAPGETFDPGRHEAVAVRASDDVPDRTIIAVQRSGYARGNRVVRPAQVVVARSHEHAH